MHPDESPRIRAVAEPKAAASPRRLIVAQLAIVFVCGLIASFIWGRAYFEWKEYRGMKNEILGARVLILGSPTASLADAAAERLEAAKAKAGKKPAEKPVPPATAGPTPPAP